MVAAGVPVLTALVLALGACATEKRSAGDASEATSSGSVAPSDPPGSDLPGSDLPSVEPSAGEESLPCVPGAEPFTGPAAEKHGAERVMAAYCMLADLVERQRTTSLALPVPEQQTRDLARLAKVLTPRVRQDWDRVVRARVAGEPTATERVNGLTLHDVAEVPRGYRRADDLPHLFGTRVGPAEAAIVGRDALGLTFAVETNLVLERLDDDSGRHSLLPVTRRGTYVLVARGDRWLVDDWEVLFERGPVEVVTQ